MDHPRDLYEAEKCNQHKIVYKKSNNFVFKIKRIFTVSLENFSDLTQSFGKWRAAWPCCHQQGAAESPRRHSLSFSPTSVDSNDSPTLSARSSSRIRITCTFQLVCMWRGTRLLPHLSQLAIPRDRVSTTSTHSQSTQP